MLVPSWNSQTAGLQWSLSTTLFHAGITFDNSHLCRQRWWENSLLQGQLCVLTLTQCLFHHRVTAVARKRHGSFCQKWRWQVTPKYAYTFDQTKLEWADYATVQAYCGNLSGNEFTCNSSGNTWSQSSQLAEPLWTDPGQRVESVCVS